MSDKISENPLQTQLQRIKSQGRQVDADLGGLNIPMLTKAMSAIQQGQQLSGQYSQQLGMFMKIVDPILNDGGALQQLLALSQRVKGQEKADMPADMPADQPKKDVPDLAKIKPEPSMKLAASVDLDDETMIEMDQLDLSELREDDEAMIFLRENPVSMAILGQYLDPKDANQVQQALRKLEAGEGITGVMGQSLLKYMDVVTDFLEKGGAGLQKLKQTAKSFLGKDIGKGADDEEMAMKMEPNMKDAYDDDPELDKLKKMAGESQMDELRKLAGLTEAKGMPSKAHVMKMCKDGMSKAEMLKMHPDADQDKLKKLIDDCKEELKEGLGYAMPQQEKEGSVSFSQEKNTDKGSVSIEANADNMEELAKIMKLAGLELPNMQQASADDEEPEEEDVLLKPKHDDQEHGDNDGDGECDVCADDDEERKPKMIVVSPSMDKSSLFNSLKAKLQDKLNS